MLHAMSNTRRVNGPSVKALRTAYGISQGEFAQRIGKSQSYLSIIENNVRHPTDPALAQRIATALGVHVWAVTFPTTTTPESEEPAA